MTPFQARKQRIATNMAGKYHTKYESIKDASQKKKKHTPGKPSRGMFLFWFFLK